MEKKYLNESRYKKSNARKRRDAKTVKNNLESKNVTNKITSSKVKVVKKKSKKVRRKKEQSKTFNVITCILLLLIIAIISRAILKDENEPFIPLPFFEQSNDQVISIGIITEESLLNIQSKNMVLNELNKYSKDMLLEINVDYTITYKCLAAVNKISNKEYVLTRNTNSKVSVEQIKNELDGYRTNKQSVYYEKLKLIESINIIDVNNINVKLKSDLPYFVYNLDICLSTSKDYNNYVQDETSSSDKLILTRHEDAIKELPAKVIVTKYKDMYAVAQAYKNKEINMFVTNAENITNILGKYEYNLKAYRNGETLFLFGNPQSKLFSIDEVRKAIAYSIDRDGIIKDILNAKGEKIDLPYIYDDIRYKYDVYAAENLLLTSGYKKSNNVYSKTENGLKTKLELNLLVNKKDEIKINIADKIKKNLNSIGIKVNVEKLSESKIQSRIENGNYDLALASVNLNNIPDISFIKNNLFITQDIVEKLDILNTSSIVDLNKNIIDIQKLLSDTVSCIGIYSGVSYLLYSKDIVEIKQVNYMNLFGNLLK